MLEQHAPALQEGCGAVAEPDPHRTTGTDVDTSAAVLVLGEAREAFVAAFQAGLRVAVAVLLGGLILGLPLLPRNAPPHNEPLPRGNRPRHMRLPDTPRSGLHHTLR